MSATPTKKAHPAARARRVAATVCAGAFVAIAGWFGVTTTTPVPTATDTTDATVPSTQARDTNPFGQGGQPGTVGNQPNTNSSGS